MMTNAGKFRHKIDIYQVTITKDTAYIKTTRGMTIIKNNSDFEKAYTNFTIRYPHTTITRDMEIDYNGKTYDIQYLSNVDEANEFLEMQCKEITH